MAPVYRNLKMMPHNWSLLKDQTLSVAPRSDPHVPIDEELSRASEDRLFSVKPLCSAISHGCSVNAVQSYVEQYKDDDVEFREMMYMAAPTLYHAISVNAQEIVTLLLEYGVEPNGRSNGNNTTPPLAFAIVQGHLQSFDSTEIVKTLLGAGVHPETVPKDMWENYMEQPREAWPPSSEMQGPRLIWCDEGVRTLLARGLNLSQRYALYRASLCKPFTTRELQSAEMHNCSELARLPYCIVGQLPVISTLQKDVLSHIAGNIDEPEPMVMVFAGPPGHGKTELAEQLGQLLSVDHETIPCSQMKSDTELLGPKQGYVGVNKGSKLNNFLAKNSGLRSVAFLDEFDKTSQEVCDSLLTVMSEGKYDDRRKNCKVDCNKTIWILANNLGDEAILRFYEHEMKHKQDKDKITTDLDPLIDELRDLFRGHWGDAFESRIEFVVPFFPFSPSEQAVVVHKFLRKIARNVRKDIDFRLEVKRLMGHCIISYLDDGQICSHLAKQGYVTSSGARGLKQKVNRVINRAFEVYNDIPGRVDESMNDGPFEKLEVKITPRGKNKQEIKVFRKQQD